MIIKWQFQKSGKQRFRTIAKHSRKTLKTRMIEMAMILGIVSVAHIGAMMILEGFSLIDAAWLTATTLVTVGYGDMSAETWAGRLCTIALMYAAGITVFAELAGRYMDWRQSTKQAIYFGKRNWHMENHIVFLNSPQYEADKYFKRLISAFRQSEMDKSTDEVLIVCESYAPNGISDDILEMGIAHVNQDVTSPEAFEAASLPKAAVVVIMTTDEYKAVSDSLTYDLTARVREANPNAIIIAEVVDDRNKDRIKAIGADHIIRPLRAYPEMVVRTILAPGTESVIEDIFDSEGEEVVRYDLPLTGQWGEIQARLVLGDIGTPLAYVTDDNQIIMNQTPEADISGAKAVFVVMREGNHKSTKAVNDVLSNPDIFKTLAAA